MDALMGLWWGAHVDSNGVLRCYKGRSDGLVRCSKVVLMCYKGCHNGLIGGSNGILRGC